MAPKNSNIQDVARRAGVSIATVSHVLNGTKNVSDATRRRVMNAVEGLQYQPNQQARSLRLSQTQDIFVLVDANCITYPIATTVLTRLVMALQKQHAHVLTFFFLSDDEAAFHLRNKDFRSAYIISDCPSLALEKEFNDRVIQLNLDLENCEARASTPRRMDLGIYFYNQIDSLVKAHGYRDVMMNYSQGSVFKKLAPPELFSRVHLAGSEFSSGSMLIQRSLNEGAGRMLYTDYRLFSGAVKYLIQHEEALHQGDIKIAFLQWNRLPETYNLPFSVHYPPMDEIMHDILAQAPGR